MAHGNQPELPGAHGFAGGVVAAGSPERGPFEGGGVQRDAVRPLALLFRAVPEYLHQGQPHQQHHYAGA